MPLTTEQKINMLILAGYAAHKIDKDIRARRGDSCLYAVAGRWGFDAQWGFVNYALAEWREFDFDLCPDELIYRAIEV